MRAALCALTLLALGCPSLSSAPGAVKAEPVTEVDLKQFFDGMLVTSNVRTPNEPVWPEAKDPQLWWVMMLLKQRFGIENTEQLRAALNKPPEQLARNDAWLVGWLRDYPSYFRIYLNLLKKDPTDLEAACSVVDMGPMVIGPEATLAAVAGVSGKALVLVDRRGSRSPGFFDERRCAILFRLGKVAEAHEACNAAIGLDETKGVRDLAKVLLAEGKFKEALTQAELALKVPPNTDEPLDAFKREFTLGLAQQHNGLQPKAIATWTSALVKWPRNAMLLKAVASPMRSVREWETEEAAIHSGRLANDLALCGHYYAELGLEARSKECYERSEKLQPGPALAHQLVMLGGPKPEEATTRALKALETSQSVRLMTAAALLLMRQQKFDAAAPWVDRALGLEPDDIRAIQLKWQLCQQKNDYACVIEYRKKLGMPTHYDVSKYRDVAKAWKEQTAKLGAAAPEPASASSPRPPKLTAIVLVPLGERIPPELEGVPAFLSAAFPGINFTIGAREDVPPGAYRPERLQVTWDALRERLRAEPGRIYVLEHDLAVDEQRFAFGRVDLETGRGAVSLARLRTPAGSPAPHFYTLAGAELTAVQGRLKAELAGVSAKLLGLSFPCTTQSCALAHKNTVTALSLGDPMLCEKHQAEWKARKSASQ